MPSSVNMKSQRFYFFDTGMEGLYSFDRREMADERGYFERAFCKNEFAEFGSTNIEQINRSFTKFRGVIRGMHFQHYPHEEQKIISCLSGKIFDVVIDLRKFSPTYLNWYSIELSSEKFRSLLIPPGFAHGFQSLTDNCLVEYFVQKFYTPEHEGGINPFDPTIAIEWPLSCTGISEKDKHLPFISESD